MHFYHTVKSQNDKKNSVAINSSFFFSLSFNDKMKQYTKKNSRVIHESISVLKPIGLTFIAHVFNEYFAPNQLFQKTPVAVKSFPRK